MGVFTFFDLSLENAFSVERQKRSRPQVVVTMALGTGNYAKKKNSITLSKALGMFGYETWSSLDKSKLQSNLNKKVSC